MPTILEDIPNEAFSFFLIDPKGWRIPLVQLQALLTRPRSEVTFNFTFEFINRAANINDPNVIKGLDELMPHGNWRQTMQDAEAGGPLLPDQRKEILAGAFSESLKRLGGYQYVAETTVLRPLRDRPLYCLFYATRHEKGIAVFRDCQVAALNAQSKTRAAHRVKHEATSSGQSEMFESMHDMRPDDTAAFLNRERATARAAMTLRKSLVAALAALTPSSTSRLRHRERPIKSFGRWCYHGMWCGLPT